MCKVVDDILPVVGAVVGSFIMPGIGTAIGAGLGGMAGNYAQTHNFGNALGAGAIAGLTSYAGGALGSAIGGAGSEAAGTIGQGFTMGDAAATAPQTLGQLESSTGGAGLFGATSGTGTAIGGAQGGLGGSGLGIAGGGALSGVSQSPAYLGALGGGTQGTGLGLGGAGQSTADLSGALGQSPATGAGVGVSNPSNSAVTPNNTLGQMSNMQSGTGVTTGPGNATASPIGSNVVEGSQAAQTGSGAPYGFDGGTSMEGTQAAATGPTNGSMAAMFGPDSTAAGSPMGQGISATSMDVPGQGVQFGALGEGTASAPGMASATQGGGGVNDFLSQLFGQGQTGNQQVPWARLLAAGQGAYQQYAQQQKYNDYVNSINQMFAPNSPYAQQMSQTLGRQDAAAGRNSQYGTRAVQLAAALTQARANALGNSNYARAATANNGAGILNSLLYNFGTPQGSQQLYNLGSAGFNGLQSLFGG